ncbi:hypothetical protein HID58_035019 [Brassica napus]|uniref:Phytocyanin domain-containing protein n=1 Tax=Brassica napus TaxID=3708 RepID=A0ABQ8C3V9_BRANA|nr:hypothetical protein HID58_035019 [Brassica napus]
MRKQYEHISLPCPHLILSDFSGHIRHSYSELVPWHRLHSACHRKYSFRRRYHRAGHTVDEVSENDYKSCTLGNSITSDSSGTTTIDLKTTGPRYFICGIPGHCSTGMKLAVTVASSTNVGGGTTTPTPLTGGGSTTTPTPLTGGGGYVPATTQAIPCGGWAVSSPVWVMIVTWAVCFMPWICLS